MFRIVRKIYGAVPFIFFVCFAAISSPQYTYASADKDKFELFPDIAEKYYEIKEYFETLDGESKFKDNYFDSLTISYEGVPIGGVRNLVHEIESIGIPVSLSAFDLDEIFRDETIVFLGDAHHDSDMNEKIVEASIRIFRSSENVIELGKAVVDPSYAAFYHKVEMFDFICTSVFLYRNDGDRFRRSLLAYSLGGNDRKTLECLKAQTRVFLFH